MASFLKRDLSASRALKEKLRSGGFGTLVHSSHPSPSLVEKLAECGFDAVLIDCEHGSAGPERVEEMARASSLSGIVSILRPEDPSPWMVTKYLECGVDGLMIPLVSDAKVAQSIVDRFRFSAPFDHQDRLLILMIETIEAVNNLPQIMAVEGVDAYLVAPGDLALTIGAQPITYEWQQGDKPQAVAEVVDRAIKTIVDAGKICGTLVNHSDVGSFVDKGVRLVYDHANHMLSYGAREFHGRLKQLPYKLEAVCA
ncbi:HpcH/HpaI aldolase family protein [Mesorhizobium captivum]|uniref:HpcH/HpaI aldolase family protein n=1 Tax=Mesorhizobium captivum TaxID=3072319 RepID=UPI002A2448FB|nr:aldolase/citrate lyase family protein [Mesorhizobium sp. VK22E]MDX8508419.1 aldolase/citrate lyase family protein [Mesorhizobium sp. VK22E]